MTIAEMKAALTPFAVMADSWDESEMDETLMDFHDPESAYIDLGHCRAARAALRRGAEDENLVGQIKTLRAALKLARDHSDLPDDILLDIEAALKATA